VPNRPRRGGLVNLVIQVTFSSVFIFNINWVDTIDMGMGKEIKTLAKMSINVNKMSFFKLFYELKWIWTYLMRLHSALQPQDGATTRIIRHLG